MTRRITILLDDNLDKKLRLYQAKLIAKKRMAVSFSQVINEIVKLGLEKK